ncbi:hypothetical protein D3C72_2481990 [compost metagenome]
MNCWLRMTVRPSSTNWIDASTISRSDLVRAMGRRRFAFSLVPSVARTRELANCSASDAVEKLSWPLNET